MKFKVMWTQTYVVVQEVEAEDAQEARDWAEDTMPVLVCGPGHSAPYVALTEGKINAVTPPPPGGRD